MFFIIIIYIYIYYIFIIFHHCILHYVKSIKIDFYSRFTRNYIASQKTRRLIKLENLSSVSIKFYFYENEALNVSNDKKKLCIPHFCKRSEIKKKEKHHPFFSTYK